jgi:endonuclease YncB( thermonuclease family)
MRLVLPLLAVAVMLTAGASAASAPKAQCVGGWPNAKCLVWDAKVTNVDDGDTLTVRVAGQGVKKIHLNGIQATEIWNYKPNHRTGSCHALEARSRLVRLVKGSRGRVRLYAQHTDSRGAGGRVRAHRSVAVRQGGKWVDAGAIMIAEGWGLPFPDGKEWAPNKLYGKLAQEAAAKRKNLWNPAGCGRGPSPTAVLTMKLKWNAANNDAKNVNGEWVRITNHTATAVPVGGWWVRDSQFRGPRAGKNKGRGYQLPKNVVIPAAGSIRVHVGRGRNSENEFYFGLNGWIFENVNGKKGGDGAYLFDPKGNLRAYSMYPCLGGNCTDPLAGKVQVTARYEGAEYEWVDIKNTSAAPISLHQYELESVPWFYEFGAGDVVLPGKAITLFIGDQPDRVPLRSGTPATTTPQPGVPPFGDTQPNGFRTWKGKPALFGDSADVVTLRNPSGAPVTCHAWGGLRCPSL